MTSVTMTELRRDIFRLIDEALKTGEPIAVSRKGRRIVLRVEKATPVSEIAHETEEERAERWRKFWAEPPPPGWEDLDLSLEELNRASKEYWAWGAEAKLNK
jgi:antitoxin (DNA-binding transcriptional repressor) of toxin-antitoxin stability system